jgi:hypothetical protein
MAMPLAGWLGQHAVMKNVDRVLVEGIGLSILAFLFSGALLYAGIIAAGDANYLRAAAFGAPGAFGLYWAFRFARAELLRHRGE